MAVLRRRSRLVYFRVSEDEFQQLNDLCAASGARSISDLARQAIQKALEGGVGNGGHARDGDLADRIDRLTSMVKGLEERIQDKARAAQEGEA